MSSQALWNPFASMAPVMRDELMIARAQGTTVWDADGRSYLDASAALWYSNLGHGREEIADAIATQLRTLDAYSTFGDYVNQPAQELATRLAGMFAEPNARVFLGSGGGDAIDTAVKIARRSHAAHGHPERTHIIGRRAGYHGTHGFGTSIAGIPANRIGFGALDPDVSHVDRDDPLALEGEIERIGPERVAAFVCEPIIGAGGVYLPTPGYLTAVAEICRKHGVLLIADCVICAFGRVGTWLGIDRWDVVPDMIALAKGITNGVQPLGALIVREPVAAPFFADHADSPVLRHGATYSGHPVAAAAALATLDTFEATGLIGRGRELEGDLSAALRDVADHPAVREVRSGVGLLAGIELEDDVVQHDPAASVRWQRACRERGILVRPIDRGVAISPPLVVTQDELQAIGDALVDGLTDAFSPRGRVASGLSR